MVTENGATLFESDAIIEYIEDEYGPLEQGVSNEQRAIDRAWSYLGSKNYLVQCGTMSSKDEDTFGQKSTKLIEVFKKAEKQLSANNKYFKGSAISNVDIAWLPLLHRADIVKQHTGYDFLCGLPKVKAWQQAMLENEFVKATVAEDFEQLFTNFYLTNTYLGTGEDVKQSEESCGSTACCG